MFSKDTKIIALCTEQKIKRIEHFPDSYCLITTLFGIVNYDGIIDKINAHENEDDSIYKPRYIEYCKQQIDQFKTAFHVFGITDDPSAIAFCSRVQKFTNNWLRKYKIIRKPFLTDLEKINKEFLDDLKESLKS